MSIFTLLKLYGVPGIIILIILIALIKLIFKNRQDVLYQTALIAVTKAQEAWGSDMGKVKFAEAYAYIRNQFPIITFFITEKQLTKIINDALNELKDVVIAKAKKQRKEEISYEKMDTLTQSILEQTNRIEDFTL